MNIDTEAVTASIEVLRSIGSAGTYIAERIRLAQGANIKTESAIRLLYAEAECNLDMLRVADDLFKNGNKGWKDAVSLISTEAMDLLLYNVEEKTTSKKLFSTLKAATSESSSKDSVSGISAAFFLYRKISALKQIADLQSLVPEAEKKFIIGKRIKNLTTTTENLRAILWKTIKTFN
jgi:hypothetical protein